MSSFTEPLVLEALAEERHGLGEFRVWLPFSYDIGFEGSGDTIVIPKGFDTDLASIPWFARWCIPISGKVAKPALVHDWLLSRRDPRADDVFAEALKVAGVGKVTRWLMVAAVRLRSRIRNLEARRC